MTSVNASNRPRPYSTENVVTPPPGRRRRGLRAGLVAVTFGAIAALSTSTAAGAVAAAPASPSSHPVAAVDVQAPGFGGAPVWETGGPWPWK